jgi:hypothetical protein
MHVDSDFGQNCHLGPKACVLHAPSRVMIDTALVPVQAELCDAPSTQEEYSRLKIQHTHANLWCSCDLPVQGGDSPSKTIIDG